MGVNNLFLAVDQDKSAVHELVGCEVNAGVDLHPFTRLQMQQHVYLCGVASDEPGCRPI